MLKLVLAEFRYHWITIAIAYAIVVALSVCHLLFEGATWQIISTTSSTVLILPLIYLGNSLNKEKRYKNAVPIPLALRKIGAARLLAPICFVIIGLLIPWLFVLFFAAGTITPTMVGRSLLIAGFLVTISSTIALVADLKHVFKEPRKKLKYFSSLIVLQGTMVLMFMSVYMLQYPKIHSAVNLQYFEYHMNNYPGVLLFGAGFILIGIFVFVADVVVFERRKTFLE